MHNVIVRGGVLKLEYATIAAPAKKNKDSRKPGNHILYDYTYILYSICNSLDWWV